MNGSRLRPQSSTHTKPLLTGPKRQHYLPRFYLENFSADGLVAVYDRDVDQVRLQQPLNTAVIGHFYTLKDAEGRKRFELEQVLAEYEDKSKPVIDKLGAGESISADERTDLAIFVAFAAMRTPDMVESLKLFNTNSITRVMKDSFSDVGVVSERLRSDPEWSARSEDEVRREASLMVEMAQNNKLVVSTEHRWAVGLAIEMAFQVAPILAGRDWVIMHRRNERKSFVTTDAPVMLTTTSRRATQIWGTGFGSADALIFFPLQESCALVMLGATGSLRHVGSDADQIRSFNLEMASRCQRFIVGRDEALLRSLAQATCLATTKWKPKIQAF